MVYEPLVFEILKFDCMCIATDKALFSNKKMLISFLFLNKTYVVGTH